MFVWRRWLCIFELEDVMFGFSFCGVVEVWFSFGEDGSLDGFVCFCEE